MVQAAIDLTGDFHAAVTALRKAGVGRAVRALPRDDAAAAGTTPGVGLGVRHRHSPGRPGVADTAGDAPSSSRFTAAVALVAKDIAAASMKLGNLTRLVRSRRTFNDPTRRINELTLSLKTDLTGINNSLDSLQAVVTSGGIGQQKQTEQHTLNVVNSLKSQLALTTKNFKDVLQIRTASMRATSDRKAVFGRERTMGKPLVYTPPRVTSLPSSSSSSSSGATGGAGAGAGAGASARSSSSASRLGVGDSGAGALPRPGGLTTPGGGTSVAGSAPTPDELFSPVSAQALLPNQEYYEARAADMQTVESTMVDLGQMFNKLAGLVALQREGLERIDDNMDVTMDRVERGTGELHKKLASVSSNKRLFLTVFAILVAFFVFFSIFIA